jgi:preprotein translocase subunit SecA
VAGLQRRTGLPLKIALPANGAELDWDDLREQILSGLESAHAERAERHLAEIERETGEYLGRAEAGNGHAGASPLDRGLLARTLIEIAWGKQTAIDRRTHRAVTVRTQRFPLLFLAADKLAAGRNGAGRSGSRGEQAAAALKDDLLKHFHGALEVQQRLWGEAELRRVATQPMSALDPKVQAGLAEALGQARFASLADMPLLSLDEAAREAARDELGRQLTNSLYRQLMLQISGQLWIDYLTAVEGLRTSVGLEAYAQRDPLLQYKSRAFDLFQELLVNMRAGVVSRLFTYRPRDLSAVQAEARKAEPSRPAGNVPRAVGRNDPCWCGSGKKFKNCHGRGAGAEEPAAEPEKVPAGAAQPEPAGKQAASKSAKRRRNRK